MRILLNGIPIKVGGGIVKFDSLINYLSENQEHELIIVCNSLLFERINEKFGSKAKVFLSRFDPANPIQHFRAVRFLNKLEAEINPDAVITLFGPSFWRPKAFHLMGFAIAHYLYPDSPYFSKIGIKQRLKQKIFKETKRRYFKRDADLWWTESEDVSLKLSKFLDISKEKIITIWPNNHPFIKSSPVSYPNDNSGTIKLLTISAYYIHKNFEIYPQVIKECARRNLSVEFVTTIDQYHYERLNSAQEMSWINLGKVSIDAVVKLYNESHIVFLPTLLECFSANYTEAMHFKRPIITSNLPFAIAACKDAALYFNPLSVIEICDCIESAIQLNDKLVSAGTARLKELESILPEQKMLECLIYNLKDRL